MGVYGKGQQMTRDIGGGNVYGEGGGGVCENVI